MTVKSFRKIKKESSNQNAAVKIFRKEIKLEVKVMNIDFSSDEKGVSIFIKCKNIKENEYVSMGQIQNIGIDLYKPITLFKEYWNREQFKLLDECQNEAKRFDSLILLCQDGHCGFYIMKNNLTILSSKLTKSLPKKRFNLMDIFKKVARASETEVDNERQK